MGGVVKLPKLNSQFCEAGRQVVFPIPPATCQSRQNPSGRGTGAEEGLPY